ncbi:MAG: PmoA family protein [Planctomycetes bacterium]|nr:PmoA family protein [Planctomycetota bacterium]
MTLTMVTRAAAAILTACAPLTGPTAHLGAEEQAGSASSRIRFEQSDEKGRMRVLIDGREAIVYQYGSEEDLVHYWPVRSPSGESMTVQHPTAEEQYPHHRSFWFGDTVQLEGHRRASFYSAYTSRKQGQERPGYPDRVRHVEFLSRSAEGAAARLECALLWEMDFETPVLDEKREQRFVALGGGEYFIDITFTLTASYGDVAFVSDAVHYAWPYVRMNRRFNVEAGGTITDSEGRRNQKETNGNESLWVDYSTPREGVTEGLAIFSHSDNPRPHQWLTRDYGCFGPRREAARSGKPFVLEKGQSLKQRVGILVHRGDVKAGRVAERCEEYIAGKL